MTTRTMTALEKFADELETEVMARMSEAIDALNFCSVLSGADSNTVREGLSVLDIVYRDLKNTLELFEQITREAEKKEREEQGGK